ncbi:MAG TPA: LPS assembly protein LptD [Sphingomonas sp.]
MRLRRRLTSAASAGAVSLGLLIGSNTAFAQGPAPAGSPFAATDPSVAPGAPALSARKDTPLLDIAQPGAKPLGDDEVAFTADTLEYDTDRQIITATGDVRMIRQGNRLRADKVVWDRKTGQAQAFGDVAMQNPQGDVVYADKAELTDDLKDGVAQDMLLVMEDGGRMAAKEGSREQGVYHVTRASYSPCDVTTDHGCPKSPLWEITASRVTYDPARHRLSYRDARMRFLGLPIAWLPVFSHPDGTGAGGNSGVLVPTSNYNSRNGLELVTPYYIQLAPNRDLTITPHLFTAVAPMADVQYRQVTKIGAFQVQGYATYSSQTSNDIGAGTKNFRGYIDANGHFQLSPTWSLTFSIRQVTDKTFLRRYDISDDDRMRSVVKAERIDSDSYLSIAGWQFRTLVTGQKQKQQPIAFPVIDYRLLVPEHLLGGDFTFEGNTLGLSRIDGQDTQRAFAGAQWEKWLLTPLGQQITFTAMARGDVYHSDQNSLTPTVVYQGDPGWQGRAVAVAAADMRWPFVGQFLGGTQRITPRVQFAISPHANNLSIPNEDSRAIDLEDTNLFALNRFPGYDRWEDGARVTYGVEYALDLPRFSLRSEIGQTYRFSGNLGIFPDGTGLSDRTSDIVSRATVRYGSFVSFTERLRLDKTTMAVRRNEADLTLGSAKTYIEAGYIHLARHIDPAIEDLRDHQEVRLGGRIGMFKRWSLYGSTTIDLTGPSEDPTDPLANPGDFDPVQSRIGLDYTDDCFEFSINWHREYNAFGDGRRGSTVELTLAFRNLGR